MRKIIKKEEHCLDEQIALLDFPATSPSRSDDSERHKKSNTTFDKKKIELTLPNRQGHNIAMSL